MELRHLRYFVAVAQAGSLSAAAEKLNLAQPPLSVQIRQLEAALGVPLFIRHPKGVKLTAAGEALLKEARFLLERVEGLRDVAQGDGASAQATLLLGFSPTTVKTVVPALAHGVRAVDPCIRFGLHERITSDQIPMLIDGRLHFGLARIPIHHPGIDVVHRMRDPYCLALPSGHPLAREAAIDLNDCAGEHFISLSSHRGPAYVDQIQRIFHVAGITPRLTHDASTTLGVLALVASGFGIAVVPASCAALMTPGVAVRPLLQKSDGGLLALIKRKGEASPAMATVEAVAREVFHTLDKTVQGLLKPDS